MTWRWRYDEIPGAPDENMALDLALLEEMQNLDALPIVRVYTWDRESVSIGRHQDEAAVRAACPDLPLVRRPTGGRAVVHGADICVTVAARLSDLPPDMGKSILASYQGIAGILIGAFAALGTTAEFGAARNDSAASWNCFASCARCDLIDVRTGKKLAGCAQRRVGTALLQQMSVPLPEIDREAFIHAAQLSAKQRLANALTAWDFS